MKNFFYKESNKIKFVDVEKSVHEDFFPVPAIQEIPEWYKQTPPYHKSEKYPDFRINSDITNNSTVKRCLPFFDSMTAGYLIKSHIDVMVFWDEENPFYQWPHGKPISFQSISQIRNYPRQESREYDYPKFQSPWAIVTPKGYSSLILNPIHRDLPFSIMEGVVDTDRYNAEISFPFYLKDKKWEGIIEAGTPIAQVIPFKRESWKMQVLEDNAQQEKNIKRAQERTLSSFINAYRKAFWSKKDWR